MKTILLFGILTALWGLFTIVNIQYGVSHVICMVSVLVIWILWEIKIGIDKLDKHKKYE
jgi:membrane associated rhomboid family serine protease